MKINFLTRFLLYFGIIFSVLPYCSCRCNVKYEDHNGVLSPWKGEYEGSSVFSCGDFHNIRCPFTLEGRPQNCSNSPASANLYCKNNRTVFIINSRLFYVISMNYSDESLRIIDPGLEKSNYYSMPQHSLPTAFLSDSNSYRENYMGNRMAYYEGSIVAVVYLDCSTNISDYPSYYLNTSTYVKASSANMSSYVILNPTASEIKYSCNTVITSWMMPYDESGANYFDKNRTQHLRDTSYVDVHNRMMDGFDICWEVTRARDDGIGAFWIFMNGRWPLDFIRPMLENYFGYSVNSISAMGYGPTYILGFVIIIVPPRFILGAPFVILILILTLRKRNRAMNANIEDFLDIYRDQMPIRYSYNDVKKMSSNFKEELGKGGFGSVYKGSLRSNNRGVAIKILNSTKGDGQDFVNEVATMGKMHHVNVVKLIGFVAERKKQALVYELMPNGSLEKYLFPKDDGEVVNPLCWEKTYKIALGIARGIEYLHKGCGMRILHFDIKPHNILLDENYNPKVSDFGLARSYSVDASMVTVTHGGARGTIGYMAPEFIYRNIGGVSYKSDVYSFGMLLMEMAGRRKNLNTSADKESQIYFPTWIYRQLNQGENIKMEDATKEENEIAKKIIIVASWCIQFKPVDRPSMTKVVEMLEGELGLLQIPDKPLGIAECDRDEDVMLNSLA